MMILPSINELMKKVDSKFTLVTATSKRARNLAEGAGKVTDFNSEKYVTIAVHEIYEGKLTYVRKKAGIK